MRVDDDSLRGSALGRDDVRDFPADTGEPDEVGEPFGHLPVEQRAVFVLHHHVGLPLTEIAENLGIPSGTARSRLHYAIRTLRLAIEADSAAVVPEGRMA